MIVVYREMGSFSAISWREQVTVDESEWLLFNVKWALSRLYLGQFLGYTAISWAVSRLYHGENKLQSMRASNCCLTWNGQFLGYIMGSFSAISWAVSRLYHGQFLGYTAISWAVSRLYHGENKLQSMRWWC